MEDIIILGAGGLASIVCEIIEEYYYSDYKIVGYIALEKSDNLNNYEYLGNDLILEKIVNKIKYGIMSVGTIKYNRQREILYNKLKQAGFNLINVIDPNASVSKSAKLGDNNIIMKNSSISSNVKLGNNIVIYPNSCIEHDSRIYDNVHISPGVNIAGAVVIEKNVFLGIGSTIIQNIRIGENSIIGAGAVVINNIPADKIVKGVPAK